MSYSVKEIYLTLQGEGFHTGKHAVFCRFSGCNLWTGLEKDREKAICNFCDTDFVGTDGINGAKYSSADKLANKIDELWKKDLKEKFVVFTGGEPLLQLNKELIDILHNKNFKIEPLDRPETAKIQLKAFAENIKNKKIDKNHHELIKKSHEFIFDIN